MDTLLPPNKTQSFVAKPDLYRRTRWQMGNMHAWRTAGCCAHCHLQGGPCFERQTDLNPGPSLTVLSFLLPSAAQPHVREPRGHPERGAARVQVQHRRQDPLQLPGRLRPGGPRDAHLHRQPRERRHLGLPGPLLQR